MMLCPPAVSLEQWRGAKATVMVRVARMNRRVYVAE